MTDTAEAGRLGRLRTIHPGWILVVLDVIGLLDRRLPVGRRARRRRAVLRTAAWLRDRRDERVRRIGGIPVAVFGVALSLILLTLALAWIRTDNPLLLDVHCGLSLIGVIFEVYFLSLQVFVIHAVCVWCTLYGLTLIARFLVALVIWIRQGRLAARLED